MRVTVLIPIEENISDDALMRKFKRLLANWRFENAEVLVVRDPRFAEDHPAWAVIDGGMLGA